jgi:hypothetical protein
MAIWGWSAVFPAVWGPDRLAKSLGGPRLSEEMGEEELAAGWSLSVAEIEFVGAKAERHRLGVPLEFLQDCTLSVFDAVDGRRKRRPKNRTSNSGPSND